MTSSATETPSTVTPPPEPRLRRWLIVVVAAVVAIALALVAGVVIGQGHKAATTTKPRPASTATAPAAAAPTGCLGGAERSNQMVLTAQQKAPHTSAGAVEVAAAFAMWLLRYPTASTADATSLSSAVLSASVQRKGTLAQTIADAPNPSGGTIPDGTPFYATTIRGVWYVESYSADRVTVSLGLPYVVNGALSSSLAASAMLTFVWERGAWRYDGVTQGRPVSDIFSMGAKFTGGC